MTGYRVGLAILFTNGTTVLQRADAYLQNATRCQGHTGTQLTTAFVQGGDPGTRLTEGKDRGCEQMNPGL